MEQGVRSLPGCGTGSQMAMTVNTRGSAQASSVMLCKMMETTGLNAWDALGMQG